MKTVIAVIVAAVIIACAAQAGQQPKLLDPTAPHTGSATFLASEFLPTLPPGWVLVNVEPTISNGSTTVFVQMFLQNPTTHQTAVWFVEK